jgi:hypothetical protein
MSITTISNVNHYVGESGDSKPTTGVPAGSRFFESDTGDTYLFDGGSTWFLVNQQLVSVLFSEDGALSLVHVRKTVTLTGAAGAGAAGAIALFTTTGRVLLDHVTAYIAAGVSAGGGTLAFGVTGLTTAIEAASNSVDGATGFLAAGAAPSAAKPDLLAGVPLAIAADVIATVGTADITGGTLVVDVWYRPDTDDGALS